jgi:serine/threonine protein kinase/tetratricopeptide (TPR) repeat protein
MSCDSLDPESIFARAIRIESASDRAAFLDQACGSDPKARRELDKLVLDHFRAKGFLEHPAVHGLATIDTPITERPGTVIGPYKLMEQIGEGGMGLVFVAEQQHPVRRKVALKVIKPGMDTRQVIARFEAERQALALMDHPNIAKVLDGGTTGGELGGVSPGRPYFVMELVKGVPITEYCDQNHVPIRERLGLFLNVCEAMQHAHQKGIIHRDIKPSNVLVMSHDGKPVVRVIDFGVAKAIGQQLTHKTIYTQFAQLVGTPLYMSPEQAGQSGLDVDTRSDIYTLGVLLYELLTGTTPFDKEWLKEVGFDEMRRIIREEEPARPSTRISTLGQAASTVSTNRKSDPRQLSRLFRGELDWIVMKALEKDRGRRYESASAFAADVQRYLNDEAVQACPPSLRYRIRKLLRRNKGPVLAASVIVCLLLAGFVGTSTGLVRALAAERQAVSDRDDKDKALQRVVIESDQKEKARHKAEAAARAEALARKQTRKALNTLTDNALEDLLGRQIQLTGQHRRFLKEVLAFHAEFAAAKADDPEGRQSQGEGYYRMGRIHWFLGDLKEAELDCANALALQTALVREFPEQPEYLQNLADSQANLGSLLYQTGRLKEAEVAQRTALARRQKLLNSFPEQATYQRDLARSYLNLGVLLDATRRLKEEEDAYVEALRLLKPLTEKFPTRNDYRESLATCYNNLGHVLSTTGRRQAAEEAYRQALGTAERLAKDFPDWPDGQRVFAITYHNQGRRLREMGRFKDAEAAYGEALKLLNRLVAQMPGRPDFRHDQATSLIHMGQLLSSTGRLTEAEAAARDALALLKQLPEQQSTRPDFRHGVAATYLSVGGLLADTGRVTEAEAAVRKAVDLLGHLSANFPSWLRFRVELADTHGELGNLLNSTGRPKQAEQAYGKALQLLAELTREYPKEAAVRQTLAFWQNNLAYMLRQQKRYAEAADFYGKALATRKRQADACPYRPDLQHSLAFTYNGLGTLRLEQGRLEDAEECFRKALTVEEKLDRSFPNNRYFRLELGRIYANLGLMLVEQKNYPEAKKLYALALAIAKQLATDMPTVSEYRNSLAIRLASVANMLNHCEEYAAAIALLEQARPHFQAALKANPRNTAYRQAYDTNLRTLARSQAGLADHARLAVTADELARHGFDPPNEINTAAHCLYLCVKFANKDAKLDKAARQQLIKDYGDRALALLQKAVAFADEKAANFPNQPQYREQVAACYAELAAALADARWPNEAEAAYLGALSIQKQLADSFRDRPQLRQELARTYNRLGVLRFTTGRANEAEGPYHDALKAWEQLVAEYDSVPDYRNGLAGALVNLAMVCNARRDFAAAVPFLQQARPQHEAALKARPKNVTYRLFKRNNLRTLAQSYLGLGDHARIATTAEELARFAHDAANDTYIAACFLSRCVSVAEKDAKLAEDKRKELSQSYADRALALLRQAVDQGYRDAARMKKEPDLQPLQAREEFRHLLAELEGKAKE